MMRSGLLACLFTLAMAPFAQAQPVGIPTLEVLIGQRPVQLDLKLESSQFSELGQACARQRSAMLQAMTLPLEQRHHRLTAIAADGDKCIMQLLKPAQKQRLRQIHWQLHGCRAFAVAEVIQELAISPDQQFRIGIVLDDFRSQANELLDPKLGRPHQPQSFHRQLAALDRPALDQIHQLLTGDQRTRWKEALGRPCPTDLQLGKTK